METINIKPQSPRAFVKERNGKYSAKRPLAESDILDQAQRIIAARFRARPFIGSSPAAREFLVAALATEPRETSAVVFLDNQNSVLAFDVVGLGTVNRCYPSVREIVRRALVYNAAAVILVHNHPSGNTKPSNADIQITARARYLLDFLDVRLLDHFIVGGTSVFSFFDEGVLNLCRCDSDVDRRAIGKAIKVKHSAKRISRR